MEGVGVKRNNKQILEKAIEKAVKNGLKIPTSSKNWANYYMQTKNDAFRLIFSHDFAKAFFGEEDSQMDRFTKEGDRIRLKEWQYRLRQMVLEKNPIKYLEKFKILL